MTITDDLGYKYPEGLDLRPGSQLHEKLVRYVLDRARESYSVMSNRHEQWRKIDQSLTAYIKLDDKEYKIKSSDERKPVRVIIPYMYATLETLLTYWTAAFLDMPVFRYEGMSPEDTIGAILLEKVLEVQTHRSKMILNLHTMARDAYAYGFGVVHPRWTKTMGKKVIKEEGGFFSMIRNTFIKTGYNRRTVEDVLYEGNELLNIDPYLYLPDVNVPIDQVQKGEYVGWLERSSYVNMLSYEGAGNTCFNVKYLKDLDGRSSIVTYSDPSSRNEKYGISTPQQVVNKPVDNIYMYANLIPKELGLSTNEYPEKWFFRVSGDKILTMAMPLGLNHNMYPIVVNAPDFDGYGVTPISKLELTFGLQETLDWMFSSHIANVRKAINDMLIVDPFLVNIKDLKDPSPGKLVRMRRGGWGRGVENAVMQLKVDDVTRQHVQEAPVLIDMIQRCTGAVDILQGIQRRTSERVSAEEAHGTRQSALSRLAMGARMSSVMAMQDLGYMMASHTQQLMSKELYVKTTGAWQDKLEEEYGVVGGSMKVSPFDLLVDFDVVIKDGSIMDPSSADTWLEMYRIMATSPDLYQVFDITRVFKHIARLTGEKNVDEFIKKGGKIKSEVVSEERLASEVSGGNVLPLPGVATALAGGLE